MPDDEPRLAEEEAEEGAPDWVVTFGDLMSLLLTFFVLLLSFSQMDVAKFKELAGSLQQAFGVQRKIPVYEPPKGIKIVARDFDQAYVEQAMVGNIEPHRLPQIVAERLRHLLKPLLEQQLVELEVQEDYVIMRLLGDVTFASGSAALQPEVKPVLRAIGSILGTLEQEIIVAGHTDNVPLRGGAFHSNLELSLARAAAVANFFLNEGLIRPDKLVTMGFGEYRPLVPNDSPEHRRRNRRVEIILASIYLFRHGALAAPAAEDLPEAQ